MVQKQLSVNDIDGILDQEKNTKLSKTLLESEEQVRGIVASSNWRGNLTILLGTVIVPVCISVYVGTVSASDHTAWFAFGLCLLFGFEAWLAHLILKTQAPREGYFVIKDLFEVSTALRDATIRHAAQHSKMTTKLSYLDATVEALSNGMSQSLILLESHISKAIPSSHTAFGEILAEILEPVATKTRHLFELSAKSKVVFTVYLWDAGAEELVVAYRYDPKKVATEFRSWKRHIGFAGKIFSNKSCKIDPDILKNGDNADFHVKGTDKEKFRSAIGVPIVATRDELDSENDPIGVLVVTSSTADRFTDKEGTENRYESMLFSFSKLVSILIDNIERETDNNTIHRILFGGEK